MSTFRKIRGTACNPGLESVSTLVSRMVTKVDAALCHDLFISTFDLLFAYFLEPLESLLISSLIHLFHQSLFVLSAIRTMDTSIIKHVHHLLTSLIIPHYPHPQSALRFSRVSTWPGLRQLFVTSYRIFISFMMFY